MRSILLATVVLGLSWLSHANPLPITDPTAPTAELVPQGQSPAAPQRHELVPRAGFQPVWRHEFINQPGTWWIVKVPILPVDSSFKWQVFADTNIEEVRLRPFTSTQPLASVIPPYSQKQFAELDMLRPPTFPALLTVLFSQAGSSGTLVLLRENDALGSALIQSADSHLWAGLQVADAPTGPLSPGGAQSTFPNDDPDSSFQSDAGGTSLLGDGGSSSSSGFAPLPRPKTAKSMWNKFWREGPFG